MPDDPKSTRPHDASPGHLSAGCLGSTLGAVAGLVTFVGFGALLLFALHRAGIINWGHSSVPALQADRLDDLRDASVWREGHRMTYRLRRRPDSESDEAGRLEYRVSFEITDVGSTGDALDVILRRDGGIYPSGKHRWRVDERCIRDRTTGENWFCRGGSRRTVDVLDRNVDAFGWKDGPITSTFRPDLGLVTLRRTGNYDRSYAYRLEGWDTHDHRGGLEDDAIFTCDWTDQTVEARDVDQLPRSREHLYEKAAATGDIGADVRARTLPLSGRNGADRVTLLSNTDGTVLVFEEDGAVVDQVALPTPADTLKVWQGRGDGPEVVHYRLSDGGKVVLGLARLEAGTARVLSWVFDGNSRSARYYEAHILADLEGCYFQFRHRHPDAGRPVADFDLTPDGFERTRGSLEALDAREVRLDGASQ